MTLKSHAKFEEKLTSGSENDMRNLANFYQNHLKVSKLVFPWNPFVQSKKCMSYKLAEQLQVMTPKNDEKSEEELTCRFKLDIRKLTNFDLRTQKCQKFTL